jgi:hypothetical protein
MNQQVAPNKQTHYPVQLIEDKRMHEELEGMVHKRMDDFWQWFERATLMMASWLLAPLNYLLVKFLGGQKTKEPESFQEYQRQAEAWDQADAAITAWRLDPRSSHYDYELIHARLQRLKQLGFSHDGPVKDANGPIDDASDGAKGASDGDANDNGQRDVPSLMFLLRAGMIRNLAGINDKRLYRTGRAGTKLLIEEYVEETGRQIRSLTNLALHHSSDQAFKLEMRNFLKDLRKSYGTSALVLHGGTSMAMCHLGVVKALLEVDLLPRVVCASFVGAVIAGIVCSRSEAELRRQLHTLDELNLAAFQSRHSMWGSLGRKLQRLLCTGKVYDVSVLEQCIRDNIGGNVTFREAHAVSQRILNIAIPSSVEGDEGLLLLNYLNAPTVTVWSAAAASCAIPGVYADVCLMCKDEVSTPLIHICIAAHG